MKFLSPPVKLAARYLSVPLAVAALSGCSSKPAEETPPAPPVIAKGAKPPVTGAKPAPVVPGAKPAPGAPVAAPTHGGPAAPVGAPAVHQPLNNIAPIVGRPKWPQTTTTNMTTKAPVQKPVPMNLIPPDERAVGYRVAYSVENRSPAGQHLTIHVDANPGAPAVTGFHLKVGSPVTMQAVTMKPLGGKSQGSTPIPSGPLTPVTITHAKATNRGGGVDLELDIPFAPGARKGQTITFAVPIEGDGKAPITAHVPGTW